jgi:hypothetical protein
VPVLRHLGGRADRGVAALVREQFGGQVQPVALNAIMSGLAVDRGAPGFGAGVLQAVG